MTRSFTRVTRPIRRLGCGIFDLAPSLLRYIEDKLHGLPARLQEGSKFTLSRIELILPRMPPTDEPINGVRYVGVMSDGKHVYENLPKKPRLFHLAHDLKMGRFVRGRDCRFRRGLGLKRSVFILTITRV